ncbi:hypothetical protein [Phenylobacterium soli]|uniref:Uncharacterized protein n=1 Tax=Phenylobacterium soli TaxID=2170551 RepID=A0A328AGM2_9CAUL|nr:hypothetical protein [Phenylobacterium soli]RAK53789.1 hypothetical protein DJ017_04225 [Phenylobacterium soli]
MLYALSNALVVFSLLTGLFALIKGGVAERMGGAAVLANFVLATANYAFLKSQLVDLTVDGLCALFMLLLMMRFASLWLGAVMLVYAIQFGLDAFYLVTERSVSDTPHAVINNLNTFAITVALAAGTIIAMRRRRTEASPPPFAELA